MVHATDLLCTWHLLLAVLAFILVILGHHSGVSRDVSKEKLTSFFNSQASFFTQLDL